jgi:hypothetical protein
METELQYVVRVYRRPETTLTRLLSECSAANVELQRTDAHMIHKLYAHDTKQLRQIITNLKLKIIE